MGGGPAGPMCAYDLARKKRKVAVFERNLAPGGGMWGGGLSYNYIVVQDEAKAILYSLGVKIRNMPRDTTRRIQLRPWAR